MRSMSQIPEVAKTVRMTTNFGGYNHRTIINDGECFDMQNMSGDRYPELCTRKKRGITEYPEALNGIAGRSKLVLIQGTEVYYGGVATGLTVSDEADMVPKKIVSIGSYVCIWPDKVYFNTHDFTDRGEMERNWKDADHVIIPQGEIPGSPFEGAPIAQICKVDGTNYNLAQITTASTAPKNPADGKLWIDTSGEQDVLRQYSSDRKEWTEVPTVYVKISAPDIGKGLQQYDSVMIENLEFVDYWEDASSPHTISNRVKQQLKDLNGSAIIYYCEDDFIVVAGMLSKQINLMTGLRVNRSVPNLDYMCESNNRIWGCKYGPDTKKNVVYQGPGYYVDISLCNSTGTEYENVTVANSAPANPENDDLWIDTSGDQDVLKKYRSYNTSWSAVQAYVRIHTWAVGEEIGKKVSVNDYVDISGLIATKASYQPTPNDKVKQQVRDMNGHHQIVWRDDKTIVIKGIVEFKVLGGQDLLFTNHVTVEKMQEEEGTFYNEIRACAQGDFKNWNKYMGLSTDSYAASVGTDGEFTGCATQQGYPVFFKENCLHKIYGTAPNSYQINTLMCRGVQKGSGRSAVVVNETILYKSMTDVMYYDGNMPQSISGALGDVQYEDARAGAVNGKYYISMRNGENWSLFCYDMKKGIWMKEDSTQALGFGTVGDELYMIDEKNNTLVTINGTDGTIEAEPVEWAAEFGISGIEYTPAQSGMARADVHAHLYMSRFDLRLKMDEDTQAELWIEYDSDGHWIRQGEIRGQKMQIFVLPVIPRRCDHLRVKLTGKGNFRILGMSRTMEVGSDG